MRAWQRLGAHWVSGWLGEKEASKSREAVENKIILGMIFELKFSPLLLLLSLSQFSLLSLSLFSSLSFFSFLPMVIYIYIYL